MSVKDTPEDDFRCAFIGAYQGNMGQSREKTIKVDFWENIIKAWSHLLFRNTDNITVLCITSEQMDVLDGRLTDTTDILCKFKTSCF